MATTPIYNKSPKRPAPAPASNRWRIIAAVAVLVAIVGFAFYKLHNDGTVTINVKDADIQDVVKKIASQSGKEILLSPNASGKVTLNIRKKSVVDALSALEVQAGGTWQEFYAVAPSQAVIDEFKKSQRDGSRAEGWTRATTMFGGFGGRRMAMGATPKDVTYSAAATPARDVALALTYRMTGEVVVADSIVDVPVTIALEKRDPDKATSEFAERVSGTVDHFFVVRVRNRPAEGGQQTGGDPSGNTPPPPPWMTGARQGQNRGQNAQRPAEGGSSNPNTSQPAQSPSGGNNQSSAPNTTAAQPSSAPAGNAPSSSPPAASGNPSAQQRPPRPMFMFRAGGGGGGGTAAMPQMSPEQQAEAEKEWQRHLNAMPPQQRAQMEEIGAQMRNVTSPQEAMQVIQNYVNKNPSVLDEGNRMMMERLKASTPEQRVEFYKQADQMRKMMQQFQQQQSSPQPAIPPSPSNP